MTIDERGRVRVLLAAFAVLIPGVSATVDAEALDGSAILQAAERALAGGEPERAEQLFEQAAHSGANEAEAELGMVRAQLSAGEYRKALAFATLVAGEHRESADATAMLAWLEFLGGQQARARTRIDGMAAQAGYVGLARIVRDRLHALAEHPQAATLGTAAGLDPVPRATGARETLRASGTGIITGEGAHVITARRAQTAGGTFVVRNALGEVWEAVLDAGRSTSEVVLLALRANGGRPPPSVPPGRAVPGSPCFVVLFPRADGNEPRWPILYAGLLGRLEARSVVSLLSPLASVADGVAFDAAGRLIGFVGAVPGETGAGSTPRVVLVDGSLAATAVPPGDVARPPGLPMGEVYERALRSVVTVFAAP